MTIDLLLYPKVTKDVKIVYPYIIFLLGGMLCQSYDHVTGTFISYQQRGNIALQVTAERTDFSQAQFQYT